MRKHDFIMLLLKNQRLFRIGASISMILMTNLHTWATLPSGTIDDIGMVTSYQGNVV